MSHKSELLEQYIGKTVKITFKNNTRTKTIIGVLEHNKLGFRQYCLKTSEFDYVFVKTAVRKIEEVCQ